MTNASQITGLLKRLDKEINEDIQGNGEFIDELQMFENYRDKSKLVGLQAKLDDADRQDEFHSAEQKKELFAKLLLKMQHYPAAQKIFALFLARINDVFEHHIVPHSQESGMDRQKIDGVI